MLNLIHGDCLDVMKTIPDASIDAIITDPPYGTTACKWDSVIPFEPMWKELNRIIKNNGAIVLFGSEPFSSALRISNIKQYKYDWVWDKKKGGNPLLSKIQPIKVHENILIFNSKIYYPIMINRDKPKFRGNNKNTISETTNNSFVENKMYTQKYPKSILEISNASQMNKVHPTQKPKELLEYLVKTYTQENETVLDFTMGSGTTGVACKNLNRNFIGIEKDDKYF
jgi:site-specific DNA-methyltransferase (adenine-specific)